MFRIMSCLLALVCCLCQANEEALSQVSYPSVIALEVPPADEVLRYGESSQQYIEGWFPNQSPLADVIFIHGGCWLSAYDIAHSRAFTAGLREAGFRVWSLEYRRTGDDNTDDEGGWPETFLDIESALTLLQSRHKITPSNTVLMGHSAGGHLALLAAQQHAEYAGVVGLAAIADVVAYAKGGNSCQSVTEQFMGGTPEQIPSEYKKANPKAHAMHKSTFLVYGDKDSIVPPTQVDGLQQVTKVKVNNAGHFDFIHPASTSFPVILQAIKDAVNK